MSLPYALPATLAVLALAYRLVLLRTTLYTVDSDQAVYGLMAQHILRGDRPIFFYGQDYQGALEAYLTAIVFRLCGQNDLTLRLVPTLFSVALVMQLYALALRLYGRRVAAISGLWLAVPPPVLVYWGCAAGAGYVEVTVLGTALVTIAIRRWGLGRYRAYDLPALGLLAGLGVWIQPMIADYLATLLVVRTAILIRHRHSYLLPAPWRELWPLPACFVAGAAPWIGYTIAHHGKTISILAAGPDLAALPDAIGRLGIETLPILAGGTVPSTLLDEFAAYANAHTVTYALGLVMSIYVLARLIISRGGLAAQARALLSGRPLSDAPLALLPFVVLGLYLASRFEAWEWTTHNPRYLLPIYTATPYVVACAVPLRRRYKPGSLTTLCRLRAAMARCAAPLARLPWRLRDMAALYREGVYALLPLYHDGLESLKKAGPLAVTPALLFINVYGGVHFQSPVRVTPLAASLLSRGDRAVYCYYWLAWRLAFESREQLIPVVTHGVAIDPRPNNNRYPLYLALAPSTRRWAYILPYDVGLPELVAQLRRLHVPYQHWHWDNASVFDGPTQPDFPPRAVVHVGTTITAAASR